MMGGGDGIRRWDKGFTIDGESCESVCMLSKNIPAKPRNPGHGPQISSLDLLNPKHRPHIPHFANVIDSLLLLICDS